MRDLRKTPLYHVLCGSPVQHVSSGAGVELDGNYTTPVTACILLYNLSSWRSFSLVEATPFYLIVCTQSKQEHNLNLLGSPWNKPKQIIGWAGLQDE